MNTVLIAGTAGRLGTEFLCHTLVWSTLRVPGPPTPKGSFQIDGMYQYHTEECKVHMQGRGKAVCTKVPQTLAGDHHITMPTAPSDRTRWLIWDGVAVLARSQISELRMLARWVN